MQLDQSLGGIDVTLTAVDGQSISNEALLAAYRIMCTIREFESAVHVEFAAGEIPGFVHLYSGQEAIAAGVCHHLDDHDYVTSTHRGHGHAIAKGCDVKGMMKEVYGRRDGLCGGKGGSMHIADFDKGMLGANAIVGAGSPLICGAGLAAKINQTHAVGVTFLGDGGANQGMFLESLNLAAVWQLPVIFVIENNGYAQATSAKFHQRGLDVADRAKGFGLPAVIVDGHDFFEVHAAAGEAVARARTGGGPALIECKVTRFHGHYEGDAQTYREAGEVDAARRDKDCLELFARRVTASGAVGQAELDNIAHDVRALITAAIAEAKASSRPADSDLVADVYVAY